MNLLQKSIVWTILVCVIAPAAGCAPVGGSYCTAAQRPFQWRSEAEIDATPVRVIRYVETEAATWVRMGCD